MKGRTHSCARSESVLRYHSKDMNGVPGGTGCSSGWRYNPSDKQRNNNSRSATHCPNHRQFRRANAAIQFATLATGLAPDNRDFGVI